VEIWPTARHFEQGRCPLRSSPPRVLLVPGSSRNDGTCPKELSKSWRLAGIAQGELQAAGIHIDLLDLSLLTSE
jgi:hypothetical protein